MPEVVMPEVTSALMKELHDLWSAERCGIKVEWNGWYDNPESWVVYLTWVSEWDNPHEATWVEYTWDFHGATPEEATTEALTWAHGLVPFERCAACDGRGWYGAEDHPLTCVPCNGSGLEHNESTV